jgi:hypothetical protein
MILKIYAIITRMYSHSGKDLQRQWSRLNYTFVGKNLPSICLPFDILQLAKLKLQENCLLSSFSIRPLIAESRMGITRRIQMQDSS